MIVKATAMIVSGVREDRKVVAKPDSMTVDMGTLPYCTGLGW